MSIEDPIFGVDISDNQTGLSMRRVAELGYKFCILRRTGGLDGQGDVYIDKEWRNFNNQLKQLPDVVPGDYAFPVNPNEIPIERQVDRFLNLDTSVDFDGRLIMIDYELYGPKPSATASPEAIRAYIAELRRHLPDHPIDLYSNKSFWDTPPDSGLIRDYGENIVTHNAWYWTFDPINEPQQSYDRGRLAEGSGYWLSFGRRKPWFSQFCIGLVDGQPADIDAYRGTMDQLLALTRGRQVEPEPVEPDPNKWDPVNGSLAPPGFVPRRPMPNSPRYDFRNPTRFKFREDVEQLVRRIYKEFGPDRIFINTYVNHPVAAPRPNVSFDIWGPAGRGDPVGFELGQRTFDFVFNDPDPPAIEWCIWRRTIRSKGSDYAPKHFGNNPFEWHDDHNHFTMSGPFAMID